MNVNLLEKRTKKGLLERLLIFDRVTRWEDEFMKRPSYRLSIDTGDSIDEELSARLTYAVRRAYPEYKDVLIAVSDKESEIPNIGVYKKASADRVFVVQNRRYGQFILDLFTDKKLEWTRNAMKSRFNHEIGHYGGNHSETYAELYALSKDSNPLDSFAIYNAIKSYTLGMPLDRALESSLDHYSDHGCEKDGRCNFSFPIKESAKIKILEKSKKYLEELEKIYR